MEQFLFAMDAVKNQEEPPNLVDVEDSSLESSDVNVLKRQDMYCTPILSDEDDQTKLWACDACASCEDSCGNPSCDICEKKMKTLRKEQVASIMSTGVLRLLGFEKNEIFAPKQNGFTMCQIRRHCGRDSAWLLVGNDVYDVTSYVKYHPGGERSILKKCGGVADCTEDMNFHSQKARKIWKKYHIGHLKSCPCQKH